MIRFIKKFAVFFIAALVLTFIWFKTAGAAETQDAARLEALAKRLNDFTSLEADFTQKRTLGAAGRTLTSTGTLSLTGDGAFSWVQKTPFVQTVSLKDGVFTISTRPRCRTPSTTRSWVAKSPPTPGRSRSGPATRLSAAFSAP